MKLGSVTETGRSLIVTIGRVNGKFLIREVSR